METAAAPIVLTAEDNPLVRADLRLTLEDAGFVVCPDAHDGVEAVELAREHRPDVILLDLRLPRLSGVDAARLIRGERDVPIVALTGYRGFAEQALAAGASSYVLKPFGEQELVDAVNAALAAHAGRVVAAARREAFEQRQYAAGRLWRRHA